MLSGHPAPGGTANERMKLFNVQANSIMLNKWNCSVKSGDWPETVSNRSVYWTYSAIDTLTGIDQYVPHYIQN